MKICNVAGNLAYEVRTDGEIESIAARYDAHIESDRLAGDDDGRTLFTIVRTPYRQGAQRNTPAQ